MAEIKTKREVGQTVWTIKGGKAKKFAICSINVQIDERGTREYYFDSKSQYNALGESECFDSKEQLIENLFSELDEEDV